MTSDSGRDANAQRAAQRSPVPTRSLHPRASLKGERRRHGCDRSGRGARRKHAMTEETQEETKEGAAVAQANAEDRLALLPREPRRSSPPRQNGSPRDGARRARGVRDATERACRSSRLPRDRSRGRARARRDPRVAVPSPEQGTPHDAAAHVWRGARACAAPRSADPGRGPCRLARLRARLAPAPRGAGPFTRRNHAAGKQTMTTRTSPDGARGIIRRPNWRTRSTSGPAAGNALRGATSPTVRSTVARVRSSIDARAELRRCGPRRRAHYAGRDAEAVRESVTGRCAGCITSARRRAAPRDRG
jgi:hypothetical protein